MTTTRRRTFVAKPSFQLKLTIIFMLLVTIVANLVGGLCFFFISENMRDTLDQISTRTGLMEGPPMSEIAQVLIPRILVAEGISLIIVFFLCIWVTHTVAGPLYRMERIAKQIGDGDLSMVTRLRPKDELQELAVAFNQMTRGLAARIYSIQDAVEELAASGNMAKGVDVLRACLSSFRLPSRGNVEGDAVDDDEAFSDADDAEDEAAIEPGDDAPSAVAPPPRPRRKKKRGKASPPSAPSAPAAPPAAPPPPQA